MRILLKIVFLSFFLCSSTGVFSQNLPANEPQPKKPIRERLFFGGELGLQFGTITFINISPLIGYKITERLSAGLGPKYLYYRDKFFAYSTSMYGGRVFVRYNITPAIFAHAEYEVLNLETYFKRRENVESIFVGGGFRQRIGQKSFMALTALWNINESVYSPYVNPIIRMEFIIGM